MSGRAVDFFAALELHWSDEHTARGAALDLGWGRIFGGQLLAQAAAVGDRFKPVGSLLHSIHGHFLDYGSVDQELSFKLCPMRKGRTYSACRVEGYQGARLIFHAVLSYQQPEEGLEHQEPMPAVPPPEELPSYQQALQELVSTFSEQRRAQIAPLWLERLYETPLLDVRPITPKIFLSPDTKEPIRKLWVRASAPLADQQELHQKLLIWTSDFPMLGTSLQPHGIPPTSRTIKMASLDHTVWLYAPFRADEWLLFDLRAPQSGSGRGLNLAHVYRQDGTLVATCAQEGMLRLRRQLPV